MLKRAINKALRAAGKQLATTEQLNFYRNLDNASILYSELPRDKRELIAAYLPYSKAQLAQDLFALAFAESTSPRFFVEFGATDGVKLSNTWLLEKKLGWSGILAEPAKTWHNSLRENRNCTINTKCVARTSGCKYKFLEVYEVPFDQTRYGFTDDLALISASLILKCPILSSDGYRKEINGFQDFIVEKYGLHHIGLALNLKYYLFFANIPFYFNHYYDCPKQPYTDFDLEQAKTSLKTPFPREIFI